MESLALTGADPWFWLGAVLLFFLAFFYYYRTRVALSITHWYWVFPAFLRGLVLCLLLAAIFDVQRWQEKNATPLHLLILDVSASVANHLDLKEKSQIVEKIKAQQKALEQAGDLIEIVDLQGRSLDLNQDPWEKPTKRSDLMEIPNLVWAKSQNMALTSVHLFTDGQVQNEGLLETFSLPLNLIPLGKSTLDLPLELSIPSANLRSVPKEVVAFPIQIIGKGSKKSTLDLFLDGRLIKSRTLDLSQDGGFVEIPEELTSPEIGKHQLGIRLTGAKPISKTWEVLSEKAKIQAWALHPHPDLSVLTRTAHDLQMRIDWNIGPFVDKPGYQHYLFYQMPLFPDLGPSKQVLWVPGSREESLPKQEALVVMPKQALWQEQMDAQLKLGNSKALDSLLQQYFIRAFATDLGAWWVQAKEKVGNAEASFLLDVLAPQARRRESISLSLVLSQGSKVIRQDLRLNQGMDHLEVPIPLPSSWIWRLVENKDKVVDQGSFRIPKLDAEQNLGPKQAFFAAWGNKPKVKVMDINAWSISKDLEHTPVAKKEFSSLLESKLVYLLLIISLLAEWVLRKYLQFT